MKNLNCSDNDNSCDYRKEFDPIRIPNILADEIQTCVDGITFRM